MLKSLQGSTTRQIEAEAQNWLNTVKNAMEESIPKSKGKICELKITPQIKKKTYKIPNTQNGCTKIWLDVHRL